MGIYAQKADIELAKRILGACAELDLNREESNVHLISHLVRANKLDLHTACEVASIITSEMLHIDSATTYVLKRTEFIEVEAKSVDDAQEKIGNGEGEHVHETEVIYRESNGEPD